MLDLTDDMATVFYGDDWATTWLRQRPPAADQVVVGIFGVADEAALDGRAVAAARVLRMPSVADVRADDVLMATVAIPDLGVVPGARFRVLDVPMRVGDGAEMEALLGIEGAP